MEDRDNRLLTIPNPVRFFTLVTLLKSPSKFALYIKYIFLFTWLCNLCVFPTLMKLVEVMSNVYILNMRKKTKKIIKQKKLVEVGENSVTSDP